MNTRSARILLIDDNKHGLIARRTLLEERGYEVETAANGSIGLEKFDRQTFDVVVTDYRMPKMNGGKVLEAMRTRDPRIPVVILSGYAKKLGLTQKTTGANAVINKGPSEGSDLIRTVSTLLNRKRPHREHVHTQRDPKSHTG
jgi:CheY-like chemotaxis protein